jgi:predicted nuclease of predicted toxin-antitoxin system
MILADHCVYEATIRLLIANGHDVVRLREIAPINSSDEDVLALAVLNNRILVTNDLDFGDIVRYPPEAHHGVILLRIRPETEREVHQLLLRMLLELDPGKIRRCLIVIDRNKYRLRGSG